MKRITIIYLGVMIACFAFLILVEAVCHNQVYETGMTRVRAAELKYQVLSDDGGEKIISGVLPAESTGGLTVAFYTVHQNVQVCIGGERIYELKAGQSLFGHTPGTAWNFVNIEAEQMGKSIEIVLNSSYPQIKYALPEIYIGTEAEILKDLWERDFAAILICGIIFLLGGVLLIYWFVMRTKAKLNTRILYLALFANVLGLWSINELSVMPLITHNGIVSGYISYISLMLMPVPLFLFMREIFRKKEHKIWDICCILSLAETLLCIILQIFNIADFRETLWITHLIYLIFMAAAFVMIAGELKRGCLSLEMKTNIVCLFLVMAGFLADWGMYYWSEGKTTIFGRVCFLIYVCVLGYASTRDAAVLLERGREAEIYHKLAFMDALTGLANRTAYSRHISSFTREDLEKAQVFILDLNDLKCCNDSLGHMIGDNYIIRAAAVMSAAFPPPARLYRIGGDEFCVLTYGMTDKDMDKIIKEIDAPIQSVVDGKKFCGRISYGFARYQEDKDIYAIVRRADEKMYQFKKRIKEESKQEGD